MFVGSIVTGLVSFHLIRFMPTVRGFKQTKILFHLISGFNRQKLNHLENIFKKAHTCLCSGIL